MLRPAPTLALAWTLGAMAGLASVLSAGAAVVLPTIAAALAIPTLLSVWVISGFSLAYAVSMAAYGRLADVYGLRAPLVAGTVLMAIGSLVAALAPNFAVLMVARIAQGVGGAAVPVLGVAIITSFRDPVLSTKGLALVTGLSSLGAGTGALVGGTVESLSSWRVALGVPALSVALLLWIWRVLPTQRAKTTMDFTGALLVTALASGVILLAQAASTGLTVAVVGGVLVLITVPSLVQWVRSHPDGFLPKSVIANRIVRLVVISSTAVPIAWFSLLAAVPIATHEMQWSPIQTGLALAPSGVIGFLSARRSARVIARHGAHWTLRLSVALAAIALAVSATGVRFGIPLLTAMGVWFVTAGFGMAQPAMVTAINAEIDGATRGVALGTAIMVTFASGAFGAAAIGGFSDLIGIDGVLVGLELFAVISLIAIQRVRASR